MHIFISAPNERNDKVKISCTPTDNIEHLRDLIAEQFGRNKYSPEKQRLFFGGKQLENGHNLFHYDIKHNNTVMLLKKQVIETPHAESQVLSVNISLPVVDFSQPVEDEDVNSSSQPAESEDVGNSSTSNVKNIMNDPNNFEREEEYVCNHCENKGKKCKECGCNICGGKGDDEHTIVCDECQYYFHFYCLSPPISELPSDEWYCRDCKHKNEGVVLAGQGLNLEKSRKSKMPSATQTKKWGGGMACVGLSRKCEIVDPDHFGPIPGVPVGSSWKYRIFCSEAGVHRPPVAGIAGKGSVGSVSIVLSGGYPEDTDNGDEFYYTGCGGRDLKTGNKRIAVQTFDQELIKMNEALARTCDTSIDDKNGGQAKNWEKSLPVRVCRSSKLAKHNPTFAPEEGIRYDGIYKLVKYWPEKGTSGFKVWRFLMRRDDPEPAPWTKEGKKRIKELGLKMYVGDDEEKPKKRAHDSGDEDGAKSKKAKKFEISTTFKKLIKDDKDNQRAWTTVLESNFENHNELIEIISEKEFKCPVCFGLVDQPVTTACSHNVCQECLSRSIEIMGKKCPQCRTEFPADFKLRPNKKLIKALHEVLPTYDLGDSKPSISKKNKGKGKLH
ncbi:20474_t:CDS:2 [Funneliformis geosporum]|uniref:RING-type E3 ubiquitin transferase n=1 Tax=Funneliformis geosporum TaxID=1117311 RepID=A0A9W4WT72_9GLOM|nr:20474_t:CDS:2 [Funneliformis geosporum]CAI2170319.1 7805_t:CDS:2 [Funneliformis geosporum]